LVSSIDVNILAERYLNLQLLQPAGEWITSPMAVLHIAAIIGVGGYCIPTPGCINTQNNTPRSHNNQIG